MNQNQPFISARERALLVRVSISAWTARKYDRAATREVAAAHGTDLQAGRYTKVLLPADAPSYKAILALASEVRTSHYRQTLPWTDEGWRLLPSAAYMGYTERMRKYRAQWDRLLERFICDYPSLREGARQRLNGLYNTDDYPQDISGKFSLDVAYRAIPGRQDFRLDLAEEELELIKRDVEERTQQALRDAHCALVERLRECVSHIVDRLSSPTAIFRDSLIENARDIINLVPSLNLAGDTKLDELTNRLAGIANADPQSLRDSAPYREAAAKEAATLLADMAAIYGGGSNDANH